MLSDVNNLIVGPILIASDAHPLLDIGRSCFRLIGDVTKSFGRQPPMKEYDVAAVAVSFSRSPWCGISDDGRGARRRWGRRGLVT